MPTVRNAEPTAVGGKTSAITTKAVAMSAPTAAAASSAAAAAATTTSANATTTASYVSERSQRRFLVGRCVQKYQEQFSFLRDSRFLQDLENDSVDSDLIEEELRALRDAGSSTREKIVKLLQSNPVQVLLCVIVLLDAGIVIAQILLDLNTVKDKLQMRDHQLAELTKFLQNSSLASHPGDDIDELFRLLGHQGRPPLRHHQDTDGDRVDSKLPTTPTVFIDPTSSKFQTTRLSDRKDTILTWDQLHPSRSPTSVASGATSELTAAADRRPLTSTASGVIDGSGTSRDHDGMSSAERGQENVAVGNLTQADYHDDHATSYDVAHGLHYASIGMLGILVIEDLIKMIAMGKTFCRHKIEYLPELAIEALLITHAGSWIVDAVIIGLSFAIDIYFVFLGGVSGEEGQKAAAVLVVLLLWRIARVVDGIVVTVKQRQEFRIRLQKRARRAAERKLETFMEEQHAKTKQIEALKDLCLKAGIKDADIAACAPHCVGPVSSTLCALSSVARLSVSMTMLMSSGAHRSARSFTGAAAVDGLSAVSGGPSPMIAQRSRRYHGPSAAFFDDDHSACATGSGNSSSGGGRPTPPTHKVQHLWKSKRGMMRRPAPAAVCGNVAGVPPSRIESLPNMRAGVGYSVDEETTDHLAQSDAAVVSDRSSYQRRNGNKATTSKFPPKRAASVGGGPGSGQNKDENMTTEESSTSCGEDSSDGYGGGSGPGYFAVIREEPATNRRRSVSDDNINTIPQVVIDEATPPPLSPVSPSSRFVVEQQGSSDTPSVSASDGPSGPVMSSPCSAIRIDIDGDSKNTASGENDGSFVQTQSPRPQFSGTISSADTASSVSAHVSASVTVNVDCRATQSMPMTSPTATGTGNGSVPASADGTHSQSGSRTLLLGDVT